MDTTLEYGFRTNVNGIKSMCLNVVSTAFFIEVDALSVIE
jgi:hypothetical protein